MLLRNLYLRLVPCVNVFTLGHLMQYKETVWRSPKVTPGLNGFVMALVTDTHDITAQALKRVVERINARKADLLLLGGDFSTDDPETALKILGRAQTTYGIFGVEGNHDEHARLFAAMRKNGITPLSNTGTLVAPGLYLAGVEDLWNRGPNVPLAMQNANPNHINVLLCHNPDVAMLQDTSAVDIMLCGHNHGGQATFLGLWAPALWPAKSITRYGHKFKSGWVKAPHNTDVLVSNGTGSSKYKPRICARPQVVFVTLRRQISK